MKATDKIQVNRYRSADELLEALNNLEFVTSIVGESVIAGTAGGRYTGNRPGTGFDADGATIGVAKHSSDTENGAGGYAYAENGHNVNDGEPAEHKETSDAAGKGTSKHGKPKEKTHRKLNKIKMLAVIAALICAIPVSSLIAGGIGGLGKAKTVEVPDLQGKTVEEATAELDELGLKLQEGDTVISEYDEGLIVSQSPEASTEVKEGKTVTVSISKGVRDGTIPKLVGSSYSDAEYILQKYNYKVGNVTYENSTLPEGIVISQSPEAGVEKAAGSYVNIVVSLGTNENEAIMPLTLGMSLDDAKAELAKAGLAVGEVTYGESDAYEENHVMWQQYEANKTLEKGTIVDLKLAGAAPAQGGNEGDGEYKAVPLTVSYNLAENQVFYLTVTVSDETGTHNVISNQQRTKDGGYEVVSLTGKGTGTVTVIIDNNVVMKKEVDFNTGEIY